MNQRFKVLYYLKKGKRCQEKSLPIYVRATIDGKRIEWSVQRICEPEFKWNQTTAKAWNMALEVVTKEDLQEFRIQLINDIRQLMQPEEVKLFKPWLKNAEGRKLLNISDNTIQRLRIAGKPRSSKVGGIHFYRYEDIKKMLNSDAA